MHSYSSAGALHIASVSARASASRSSALASLPQAAWPLCGLVSRLPARSCSASTSLRWVASAQHVQHVSRLQLAVCAQHEASSR